MSSYPISEDKAKEIRKFIYDTFIETAHAPVLEEIVNKFKISNEESFKCLMKLANRHLIVLQASTNRILMAHPFSNIPTCWQVKTDQNQKYYANCAWDAIAMHFTLHKNIYIDSFCHCCNARIKIRLDNQVFSQKEPKNTIIALSKPVSRWWSDIVDTCANHMNFFCSANHLDEWKNNVKIPSDDIAILSEKNVLELSRFLYDKKIELNYQRPTEEEEKNLFKELNLVEDFWKI